MEPFHIIWQQLLKMGTAFLTYLPQLVIAILVLGMTWAVARLMYSVLARALSKLHLRPSLVELFQKLAFTAVWLSGLLTAALIVFPTLTPAKVLTAIGLGSIAIGLAFKDIFENFFAGVLILLREPFQLGDFVECEGIEGQVEDITIRDTHLRQTDGQRVVIPNAQLFKHPVKVRTDLDRRRVSLICGVAYGEDVDHAREVIYQAINGLETVDPQKEVQVFARQFASSSIDFEVTWWTGSRPLDIRASRDLVVAAIKRALDEAGIEIPFPYRTLTFKEPLQTVMRASEMHGNHHAT